jgi:dephospho-CoA kinase
MQVWGITGLTGTGKSTATEYLQSKGYPSIHLEDISRRLINKDTAEGREGFEKIYKIFGNQVLNAQGGLDRSKLMRRLMLNPVEKKMLEEAIDPLVAKAIDPYRIRWKESGNPIAFIEGSRLFESGIDKGLRGVVALKVDFDKRVKRLAKRDTMGIDEVKLMCQIQDTDLIARLATEFIDNNGSLADLKKRLDKFVNSKLSNSK